MSGNRGSKRLARILKLIPFLQRNSGIDLHDVSNLFGITQEQLIADLNLIWMCGLPGYTHLELMDVSYDSGFVTLQNAHTLARPMRMTFDEGAALLLAIENLVTIAPSADVRVLTGLRKKIADLLALHVDHPDIEPTDSKLVLPEIIRAIENHDCLLDLDYYSATLDDNIRQTVQPVELLTMNGFVYLSGYSIEQGRRLFFRLDRIHTVSRSTLPMSAHSRPGADSQSDNAPTMVDIRVGADAYWFIQKWHLNSLTFNAPLGSFVGQIPVYNPQWLARAVLSAAGAISVSSPPSMRSAVAQAAQRTLEKYMNPLN